CLFFCWVACQYSPQPLLSIPFCLLTVTVSSLRVFTASRRCSFSSPRTCHVSTIPSRLCVWSLLSSLSDYFRDPINRLHVVRHRMRQWHHLRLPPDPPTSLRADLAPIRQQQRLAHDPRRAQQ
ncbi:hypothetical protein T310_7686, partial [Rasamsonia emersonii CBS 393.64]